MNKYIELIRMIPTLWREEREAKRFRAYFAERDASEDK